MKQWVEERKSRTITVLSYLGEQMIENGLYVVKRDILNIISSLGGDCDMVSGDKRPVFCCMKDNKIQGLCWAIPTSDLSHRSQEQIQHYETYMRYDTKDLRSSYYHIVNSNRKALYKISSCYPITEKYIDHEYKINNKHVIIQRNVDIQEINRKFRKIISYENKRPNYFHQHITDVRNYLIAELQVEQSNNNKDKEIS